MENPEINSKNPAHSAVLNNTGGPMSRTRTTIISSSIFTVKGLKSQNEKHSFEVPENINDIEGWLAEMAGKFGWKSLEIAITELKLPEERFLVFPQKLNTDLDVSIAKWLRSALILSKCNQNFYNPDSPMIFTRNRLHRSVELIKINLNRYYGLD